MTDALTHKYLLFIQCWCWLQNGSEARLAYDIGFDIWPASLLLAEYLAERPSMVAGCSVLEVGSGAGLCGLAAATLSAKHTVLTDYSSAVCFLVHAAGRCSTTQQPELPDCCNPGLGRAAAQRSCKRPGCSHSCGTLGLGTAGPLRARWAHL